MQEAAVVTVTADAWAVAAFLGYLVVLVGIGIYASRFSSAGIGEFFVGGRKMNRLVVALSAVVSGRSAWLLLGVTGMAYGTGASAIWAVAGYTVVECLLFLFYAPRLRRFAERYDCITVPDFFAARFGDDDGRLRILLSAVILVFMVGYVSAQFAGGGKAFAAGFGLEPSASAPSSALPGSGSPGGSTSPRRRCSPLRTPRTSTRSWRSSTCPPRSSASSPPRSSPRSCRPRTRSSWSPPPAWCAMSTRR